MSCTSPPLSRPIVWRFRVESIRFGTQRPLPLRSGLLCTRSADKRSVFLSTTVWNKWLATEREAVKATIGQIPNADC